ncbi:MAG: thermostable hemolysin [Alishewanella sp.]|nr:thermostable hemolysin [Alishewanella sp.]
MTQFAALNALPRPFFGDCLALQSSKLTLHTRHSADRAEIEQFIQQQFRQHHQADINFFMPVLLSLHCAGQLTAVVGLTAAATQPLFLEQYLPAPIEQVLSAQQHIEVPRQHILEVGNLVASRSGSSLLLMVVLSELIIASPYQWIAFTATSEVQSLLSKLHYQPLALAPADVSKLADNPTGWGRYYQKQPTVMAGHALPAIASAQQLTRYQLIKRLFSEQITQISAELNLLEHSYA